MTFAKVAGPHYIKRTLVYVSSSKRDPLKSENNLTYTFPLPEQLQNVVGIELKQYSLSTYLGPSSVGQFEFSDSVAGTTPPVNYAAVQSTAETPWQFESYPDGADFDFKITSSFDPAFLAFFNIVFFIPLTGLIAERPGIGGILSTDWEARLYYFGLGIVDGTFDLSAFSAYDFETEFSLARAGRFYYGLKVSGTSDYATVNILYGEQGSDRSSATVLGFNPYRNTDFSQEPVVGDYLSTERRFPYVDVFIQEMSELGIVARIPLVEEITDNFVASKDPPPKVRILKNPVQRLKELTISLRLENGIIPSSYADIGHDLVFEVYSLSQVGSVPEWVEQALEL